MSPEYSEYSGILTEYKGTFYTDAEDLKGKLLASFIDYTNKYYNVA